MNWRHLLALWVPPILARRVRRSRLPVTMSYRGLNGLDRELARHLDLTRPGYFVELGANDGLRQSNTYFLEQDHGWSGVLIEPALNNYLDLIANRSPKNRFFCCACVPFDYESEFVRLTYANLMSVAQTLDSDLEDVNRHVESGAAFLKDSREIVEFGAVARPLSMCLEEASAPTRMELLSLDVEGAELEVLRGIDHERHRFRNLLVECRDLPRLRAYLEHVGYELAEQLSFHDYLFVDVRGSLSGGGLVH